ncbi:MAG: YeeE/YedE thiosulfate transporter family protein [Saprospiraceae bacterium]|nr:YeeE/YedE thiosulfate transporter family protein [Saprospiraceae bacterium]
MKYLKFIALGVLFGIVMAKSEVISWYRIYEMFRFEAFHMYGIIGSAVILGVVGTYLIKKKNARSILGEQIYFAPKQMSITRYLVGGILFGLGWALVGACPGPMFVLIGAGFVPILIVLFGALIGTFVYGVVRSKLPH